MNTSIFDTNWFKVLHNGLYIEEIPLESRDIYICKDALRWAITKFETNDANVRSDMCTRIKNCFPQNVVNEIQDIKEVFALVGITISDLDIGIADSRTAEQMVEMFIMRQPEPDNADPIKAHHVIELGFLPEVAEHIATEANAITSKSSVREQIAFVACRGLKERFKNYLDKKYGPKINKIL